VTPFALCDRPSEAEARWLEWCNSSGLSPGNRGAISRLRKIMYDELWGRLVDGEEGWAALANMGSRDWQADYVAGQQNRLEEEIADYACSMRSASFLESAVHQVSTTIAEDCGICLQAMRSPRMTPCAHIFCAACIEQSLATKAQCPQCRAPVFGLSQLSSLETGSSSSSASVCPDQARAGPSQELSQGSVGSKISYLVAKLEAIQQAGQKAVVFAQWQDLIHKIHAVLTKFGVPAAILCGGAFDRASVLQRFESPSLPVLLLSLEDSASGTNMTHASHVLLVHPMVANSAEEQRAFEAQAIGRVRRWGQRRRVQVWRFVMADTIEEELAALPTSTSPTPQPQALA